MTHSNRPEQSAGESGTTAHWSASWLPTIERSGHRMQQFQHAAQDLQKAVNQESIRQIEDMFAAMSQISSAVNDAARENSLTGVFGAQPRVLECMMQITQRSNERLMRITERVNACTVAVANGEAAGPDAREAEQPGNDDSTEDQSTRSGKPHQTSQQDKQAAAGQES